MDHQQEGTTTIEEVPPPVPAPKMIGQVKWFNDRLGYGFITISDGEDKGKDVFVHYSGIHPMVSNYRTLRKGEYVSFYQHMCANGAQAVDVTGVCCGPLMCDVVLQHIRFAGFHS